jgi:ClpP class serine protease
VFFSLKPPYLPIAIPHRAVNDEERTVILDTMHELYTRFVNSVATNRKMDAANVESLAQGRVWTGLEAKKNGLVDRIGGLQDAIMIAREMAGIPAAAKAEIVEYAPRGLFKMDLPIPGLTSIAALPALFSYDWSEALMTSLASSKDGAGSEASENYGITYLRHMMKYNGRAQCILSPDMIPEDGGQ